MLGEQELLSSLKDINKNIKWKPKGRMDSFDMNILVDLKQL